MRNLNNKLTFATVLVSILAVIFFHQTYDFNNKKPGPEISISIPDGATGTQIGEILMSNGVIKSKKFFVDFYITNQSARGIAPGVHKIQTHISTKLAVAQLLDQKRIVSALKIVEGTTFSDVLKELRGNKNIQFTKPEIRSLEIPLKNRLDSVEGQLYPAIYSFEPGTTTNQALQSLLNKFATSMQEIPLKKYENYSKYQVLTIASMVQVEGDRSDFEKVARVIYNRLKINMPLQLNSTVQYAANLRGRIALSTEATRIDSPYNTYKHTGLPPTPISNPSVAAIRAAMSPAAGDWLYFITVKPGDTRFTKDFNEFQKWNVIYNNNLANGLFK